MGYPAVCLFACYTRRILPAKWCWLLVVGVLVLPLRGGWAGNTHSGTGDAAMEQRAWWGDGGTGYVVDFCLHELSGTTSAVLPRCRAYVLNTEVPRQLEYVEELTPRTITYTAGAGTYWLIAHAETTEPVLGWTRSGITHYLWQRNTTQPLLPSRATWLARVTVTGTAITNVTDWRSSNPEAPHTLRATDPIWGAVPNDGANDQGAIQGMFAAAKRGNVTLIFPPGIYDVEGNANDPPGTAIAITLSGVRHVRVQGYGAVLRAGAGVTSLLGIMNSAHVTVEGLHLIGHTQLISPYKHGIAIGHRSSFVEIAHTYVTNFLGDAVHVGGDFTGPNAGQESWNVWLHHNTFKEREGNGLSAENVGGTGSRLALGVGDGRHVTIEHNTIFGTVDLEPDVANQYLYHIVVKDNVFHSGPVTAQTTVGTTYHHDEPILAPGAGGVTLVGVVLVQGHPVTPVVQDIHITRNAFERGRIHCMHDPYTCVIDGNTFHEGLIHLSLTTGVGITTGLRVTNNVTTKAFPGQTTFIRLDGGIQASQFLGNIASIPGGYTIQNAGAGTGDGGRNVFLHNINASATAAGVLGFPMTPTTVAGQNYFNQAATSDHLTTGREAFVQPINLLPIGTLPVAPGLGALATDTSGALCWFNGSTWVLVAGTGTCS